MLFTYRRGAAVWIGNAINQEQIVKVGPHKTPTVGGLDRLMGHSDLDTRDACLTSNFLQAVMVSVGLH